MTNKVSPKNNMSIETRKVKILEILIKKAVSSNTKTKINRI